MRLQLGNELRSYVRWTGLSETFAQFFELAKDVLVFESKFIHRFRRIVSWRSIQKPGRAAFRVGGFLKFFS